MSNKIITQLPTALSGISITLYLIMAPGVTCTCSSRLLYRLITSLFKCLLQLVQTYIIRYGSIGFLKVQCVCVCVHNIKVPNKI